MVCAACHVVVTAEAEGLLALLTCFRRRDPDVEVAVASPHPLGFVSFRTLYLEGVSWAILSVAPQRRVESARKLFARGVELAFLSYDDREVLSAVAADDLVVGLVNGEVRCDVMELFNARVELKTATRAEPLVLATEKDLAFLSQEQSEELAGLSFDDGLPNRIFRPIDRPEFVLAFAPALSSVAVAHDLAVRSHEHDVVMTGSHEFCCNCHFSELRVIIMLHFIVSSANPYASSMEDLERGNWEGDFVLITLIDSEEVRCALAKRSSVERDSPLRS